MTEQPSAQADQAALPVENLPSAYRQAVRAAANRGQVTVITEHGEPVAAITPPGYVTAAEAYWRNINRLAREQDEDAADRAAALAALDRIAAGSPVIPWNEVEAELSAL